MNLDKDSGVKKKRKVLVFTGNRAEYSLQYPILRQMAKDPLLDYYLVVSGAHLKGDFGRTLREIEEDGFRIGSTLDIDMGGDDLCGTARAIGSCSYNLAPIIAKERPDLALIYADRFESFGAMIATTQMGVPTGHVEGGDYTEGGALDDSVRHAMTKLAHLHFTTSEESARRVLNLGEEPWRVHQVGFPTLDLVAEGLYAKPDDVRKKFELSEDAPLILFTQHSISTEYDRAVEQVRPSLDALKMAVERWGCQVIMTYPNDDAGGKAILLEMQRFMATKPHSIQLHPSLGRYYYHGALAIASVCVGNTSSGIKETPAFHCPFVLVGSRQDGRLRGDNVIRTDYNAQEILQAIDRSLHDDEFLARVRNAPNPYGAGNAGKRICEVLASVVIDQSLIRKKMTF